MKSLHWYSELRLDNQETQPPKVLPALHIEGVEKSFGVIFPDGYKQLIALHHGDSPLESHYRLHASGGEMHGSIGMFLSLDPYAGENIFRSAAIFSRGIVPFAVDGGGNFICFDYRNDITGKNPVIVYWDHEIGDDDNYFYITDSFDGLVNSLSIPDDVIEDLREQGLLPQGLS